MPDGTFSRGSATGAARPPLRPVTAQECRARRRRGLLTAMMGRLLGEARLRPVDDPLFTAAAARFGGLPRTWPAPWHGWHL